MSEIVPINSKSVAVNSNDFLKNSENLLVEVRNESIPLEKSIAVPIAKMSTLGASIASLVSSFTNMREMTMVDMKGYYQLANESIGDTLKKAKNGNFWGAFKTIDGKSKFVQLKEVDSIKAPENMVMKVNPAMILMAVALYSVEKELINISDMEKQIISFLEIEKESEIEADVITLSEIIKNYKHNWDNEHYVTSNHKMVLDIQRTARKNMISYQKQLDTILKKKRIIPTQSQVKNVLKDLLKKFRYYNLSLYSFALSSFEEIMLSGNFKEEYIDFVIDEIRKNSEEYRELFGRCSGFLEEQSGHSLDSLFIRGVGSVSGAVGKVIGSIPKVRDGQVDEFLQDKGAKMKESALKQVDSIIHSFAEVSDPNTGMIMSKMDDMINIYNKTKAICFDRSNIYLIAD